MQICIIVKLCCISLFVYRLLVSYHCSVIQHICVGVQYSEADITGIETNTLR